MHELSIVDALIEQVAAEVQRSGHAGRVSRLDLTVGRLSGVNVDSIRFAFDLLKPGTALESATLVVSEPKATCHCVACDARTEIDELSVTCPACGASGVRIEGGQELLLQSIELLE